MMRPDHPGLRPFQAELGKTLYERLLSGAAITVAWVAAGSGKTKGYYHACQRPFREGLIPGGVLTFVPRVTLKEQVEIDFEGWRRFYDEPVMAKICAQPNETPLTRPDEFGYISTYNALVANPKIHLEWAKARAGRFILICDEAQFLGIGSNDDDDIGTQAATHIKEIASYAKHTLLTTGTTTRSDYSPLVLAEYSDPDRNGRRYLQWHVKATYQDGVRLRYLRPAQFSLTNGTITFSDLETDEIATLERRLHQVLREPAVWQELCRKIVAQLLECRRSWPRYRALISCIDQKHARLVADYLAKHYPNLVIKLAVSDDGKEALDALKRFRPKEKEGDDVGDILVTVGMVSIGYDAPTICVVGNLSSRRWEGWLLQFFARGARVWEKGGPPVDGQICHYISTDDPLNRRFAERMRQESDTGIRERRDGEAPQAGPDVSIIDVQMTDEEMLGLSPDQDLTAEQLAGLRQLKLSSERYVPETLMAEIFRAAGHPIPTATVDAGHGGRTGSQKRKDNRGKVNKGVGRYVITVMGLPIDHPEYSSACQRMHGRLNSMQGVPNIAHCTEAQLIERIRILDEWIASGARL